MCLTFNILFGGSCRAPHSSALTLPPLSRDILIKNCLLNCKFHFPTSYICFLFVAHALYYVIVKFFFRKHGSIYH